MAQVMRVFRVVAEPRSICKVTGYRPGSQSFIAAEYTDSSPLDLCVRSCYGISHTIDNGDVFWITNEQFEGDLSLVTRLEMRAVTPPPVSILFHDAALRQVTDFP
jgi:hypothetical protein